MEEQNNPAEQLRTVKQEKFITQLLQSRVFSKKEFEVYMNAFHHSLKDKHKASLFIETLLTEVRYRKAFRSNKQRAKLKCAYCGSRKHPIRRYSIEHDAQSVICEECQEKFAEHQQDALETQEQEPMAPVLSCPAPK